MVERKEVQTMAQRQIKMDRNDKSMIILWPIWHIQTAPSTLTESTILNCWRMRTFSPRLTGGTLYEL